MKHEYPQTKLVFVTLQTDRGKIQFLTTGTLNLSGKHYDVPISVINRAVDKIHATINCGLTLHIG